ncbi:glycoside hydrolase family 76 protein [Apiospora rasikravindrae]|uniref:Glycoside hydrolase family 76 protein n=1 Tax=Apiospora rasikravindrae TaxID=990691 RepID=A0ABR1T0B8_9PEZI
MKLTRLFGASCLLFPGLVASLAIPKTSAVIDATKASINALNTYYDNTTGRWNPKVNWWYSGIALQAILDYMQTTGSEEYLAQAQHTIDIQRAPLDWYPQGGGDFRADSTDDTAWWALALLRMYELTGNSTYLDIAKEDEAYIFKYWLPETCKGGVIWNIPELKYKNAISNELYLELAASLHNLIPGDTFYLNRSMTQWAWFNSSGMINSQWLINDGLLEPDPSDSSVCRNNNAEVWTYNQGVVLGGLVELHKATGDQKYLDTAIKIADAVVNSATLSPGGILTETCSETDSCTTNGWSFKGIFMNRLAKLNKALSGNPYSDYIRTNEQTMYSNARNGSDFYGGIWQKPFDGADLGKQVSAVSLLIATLGLS